MSHGSTSRSGPFISKPLRSLKFQGFGASATKQGERSQTNIFQPTQLQAEPAPPEEYAAPGPRAAATLHGGRRRYLQTTSPKYKKINKRNECGGTCFLCCYTRAHGRLPGDKLLFSQPRPGKPEAPEKQNGPCWTVYALESKSRIPRMIYQDGSFIINLHNWAGSTARGQRQGGLPRQPRHAGVKITDL